MPVPNQKLRWALLLTFILATVSNFGVFWLPVGQDQFANAPNTRIDAAAYAFPAIWTLIFFGMIALSIYLIRNVDERSQQLDRAIMSLLVAGLASIVYVPIKRYGSFVAGWLDVFVHLIALVIAVFFLRKHVATQTENTHTSGRWLFFAPSFYLGWISAALAISTALALRELKIDVDPELARVVTMMVIACLTVVGAMAIASRDAVYGLALVWAFAAIGVEQAAFPSIQWTAWGAAGLLTLLVIISMICRQSFYAVMPEQSASHPVANDDSDN